MSSLDTTMGIGDTFVSNTDAIIYPISDYSGWGGGDSMISDPNIVLSSTSTDDHYQQQISTGGGGDDLMSESSSSVASSSWFKNINNNNNHNKQREIRIFNVDFRALSEQVAVPSSSSSPSPTTQLLQKNSLAHPLGEPLLELEITPKTAVPSPPTTQSLRKNSLETAIDWDLVNHDLSNDRGLGFDQSHDFSYITLTTSIVFGLYFSNTSMDNHKYNQHQLQLHSMVEPEVIGYKPEIVSLNSRCGTK